MIRDLADVGRDALRGGYSRPLLSDAELELRQWFHAEAGRLGLDVETDPNGVMWAWWDAPGRPREDAVATGSHVDSVPGGGAFDGPLGVASALAAIELMRESGTSPSRPIVVVVFPEEEGSRFGVPCLGSGLMTGTLGVKRALALKDENGDTLADVLIRHGMDPDLVGPDPGRLARITSFVELHIEQGRGLVDLVQPVAIGGSIISHGRWKMRFTGQGNHAGTTLMAGRRDPMIAAAGTILAAQEIACAVPGARATVGKVVPVPGGSNVIPSVVDIWMDARHADETLLGPLVDDVTSRAEALARTAGCDLTMSCESYSPTARFDSGLVQQMTKVLPAAPVLDTGAGHDAGVLAPFVASAMLFVRNPAGISHSPEEHAEDADMDSGAEALARVLTELTANGASNR